MKDYVHAPSPRGTSVKDDWRARLSEEKNHFFETFVQQVETSYAMFSISLNEAIELRQAGLLAKSFQVIWISPSLCSRMTELLAATLRALAEHAKHYGTIPNSSPLDAANFQSAGGQRSARMSGLLSRVLLTQRSQFLHKISTLHEMVEDLSREFQEAADQLSNFTSVDPLSDWSVVDVTHYDLNTCLREAIVLLKSFLVAIPDNQLESFQKAISSQMRVPKRPAEARQTVVRHRRMPAIAGQ